MKIFYLDIYVYQNSLIISDISILFIRFLHMSNLQIF